MTAIEETREKKKLWARKFRATETGKKYLRAYSQTDQFRSSQKKYCLSEKGRITKANWRHNNKTKINIYAQGYVEKPEVKEKRLMRHREYNKIRQLQPKYRLWCREYKRKYMQTTAFKEKNKVYQSRYRASAKGRASAITRDNNRRAHELNAIGVITKPEWEMQLELYANRCVYCNRELDKPEMDHIIPLSKGGEHIIDNVVPACRSCNAQKRDRGLLQFLMYRNSLVGV